MKKRNKIIIALLAAVIAVCAAVTGIYANDYYRAVDVDGSMTGSSSVKVSKIKEGYFFDGPSDDRALIFYPGAKVEETAYAPLMYSLAKNGVDCFLVKMPMKLAFLGADKADAVTAKYKYESYYLAGHSLGGAMAANHAAKHAEAYAGLFLLAAYPTEDLTFAHFPVVFIYGENDKVLNREKLKNGYTLVPKGYKEIVIEGGNHAGFGSYGNQKGDGKAAVSPAEQQKTTADIILKTVKEK